MFMLRLERNMAPSMAREGIGLQWRTQQVQRP